MQVSGGDVKTGPVSFMNSVQYMDSDIFSHIKKQKQ